MNLFQFQLICKSMAKRKMADALSDGVTAWFDNQENCDVTFEVGGKRLKAHKLVLAVRSEVLDDLSHGWTPDMNPIQIDAVDYNSFEALLR